MYAVERVAKDGKTRAAGNAATVSEAGTILLRNFVRDVEAFLIRDHLTIHVTASSLVARIFDDRSGALLAEHRVVAPESFIEQNDPTPLMFSLEEIQRRFAEIERGESS